MPKKNPDATIAAIPKADILALTKTLLEVATRRLANGQDVSQENIATVNRARKAVSRASK
jgi:hypothetical protein